MPDTTTIQDFFSRAARKQFSRDFLFRVQQIQLVGGTFLDGESDLVYARTASLPGRTIENKTVNYFGQEFQVPGRATYENAAAYSINFYHDENCELRTKLERASRDVFNNDTSTGAYGMPGEESIINLVQIDKQLRDVRKIQLVGASIRDIGGIEYSIADGSGDVLNFPVTFAYHFYRDFSNNNRPR
jgi:hypothetical protein|tara:strand:- start:10434 stop:10994 length:561 start_codon:yes stop_codon:yes gene_type:complete